MVSPPSPAGLTIRRVRAARVRGQAWVTLAGPGGGRGHGLWFAGRPGARPWADLDAADPALLPLVARALGPGGAIMVAYGAGETERALRRGAPAAATPLGLALLRAGCRWLKDFGFAEGGMEGPAKLLGELPADEAGRRRAEDGLRDELRGFLARADREPRDRDRAREALALLEAPDRAGGIGDPTGRASRELRMAPRAGGASVAGMTQEIQPYHGSYLVPAFERASVADVMRAGVMSCAPDAALVTVAQTMATHHVHAVVVADVATDAAGGEHVVWGLVSDMDLVRSAESGIEGHTAADAARTELVTVEPTAPLAEAARLMDEHGTAHLLVTSGGHPAGVVSSLDIAGALAWGRA